MQNNNFILFFADMVRKLFLWKQCITAFLLVVKLIFQERRLTINGLIIYRTFTFFVAAADEISVPWYSAGDPKFLLEIPLPPLNVLPQREYFLGQQSRNARRIIFRITWYYRDLHGNFLLFRFRGISIRKFYALSSLSHR